MRKGFQVPDFRFGGNELSHLYNKVTAPGGVRKGVADVREYDFVFVRECIYVFVKILIGQRGKAYFFSQDVPSLSPVAAVVL